MADASGRSFGAARIAGEQHHAGAMIGEYFRYRFADAHRRARDHHYLAGDIHTV